MKTFQEYQIKLFIKIQLTLSPPWTDKKACRLKGNKAMPEPMLTKDVWCHIDNTRPQWVKGIKVYVPVLW